MHGSMQVTYNITCIITIYATEFIKALERKPTKLVPRVFQLPSK
jgi:hypothetical protein